MENLTPREYEIAELAAEGLTNAAIAEKLIISPRTVETHIKRVLDKLESKRSELPVLLARNIPKVQKKEGNRKALIKAICKGEPRTIKEVSAYLNCSRQLAYQYLKELGLHKKVRRSHDRNVNT